MNSERSLMKNKLIILSSTGVVLVAAVFIFSLGYFQHSQHQLNRGLWNACKFNNAAAASYWLAKGANVNAHDAHGAAGIPGRTALHMCAHFGNVEIVNLLLMVGADPNATDDDGRTALFFTNFATVANALVRRGAKLGHKDDNGETALEARIAHGWHVDEALKAALTSENATSSTSEGEELEPFVKNLDGVGTAWVWDIHFHVEETNGRETKSQFKGMLGPDAHSERTDAVQKITLGDVLIVLTKRPGRPMTLEVNGMPYGTLEPEDKVSIDAERTIRVNGTPRIAANS